MSLKIMLGARPFSGLVARIGLVCAVLAMGFATKAQTIITTTGADYTGANATGIPGAVTFGVENTNATSVVLSAVGTYLANTDPSSVFTLWYTPTQLTGAPTINNANGWTQIAAGGSVAPPFTSGIVNVISGMNFSIPGNTIYRFALVSASSAIHYSGTAPTPASPNVFSASGINLLVSDNSQTPGYAGTAPSPTGTPLAFTGRVTFQAPCSGTPIAGNLSPGGVVSFCTGASYTITRQGGTQASGLGYLWEQASPTSGGWSPALGGAGANTASFTTPVLTDTIYYRLRVTCVASGQSATTNPVAFNRANFYACYCASTPGTPGTQEDIGRVIIITDTGSNDTLLVNGAGTPIASNTTALNGYTNFSSLTPTILFRDSLYRAFIQQISRTTNFASVVSAWIDFDQNSVFNTNELLFSRQTAATSTPTWSVRDTFRIPGDAKVGITGMRLVLQEGTTAPAACGTSSLYNFGETEDYLVNIQFPPCDGPAAAGTAYVSDTVLCQGYLFTLTDTTHERQRSALTWNWQTSINGGITWTNVANSTNKDTIQRLFTAPAQYRLRMICTTSSDTTYSNPVNTTLGPPYACYCYSITTGFPSSNQDSSDIGAFRVGNFLMVSGSGGPHLQNPDATRQRTDYTSVAQINLVSGNAYVVNVFHTMRARTHNDAKITVFIDFDNDFAYDIPRERVLTGYTTATNWYFVDSVRIPLDSFIADVPTGMRVVLNENINASLPSDNGCGTYTSGETEDYVVILRTPQSAGVGNTSLVRDLTLYPNPTNGRTLVTFRTSKPVKDVQLVVTDLTGRTLTRQTYDGSSTEVRAEVDLSGQPRGMYFIEVLAEGEKLVKKLVVR